MHWQRKTIDKQKKEKKPFLSTALKAVGLILILLSSIIAIKNPANITYTPCVSGGASQYMYVLHRVQARRSPVS